MKTKIMKVKIKNEMENFKSDLIETLVVYKDSSLKTLLDEIEEIYNRHEKNVMKLIIRANILKKS